MLQFSFTKRTERRVKKTSVLTMNISRKVILAQGTYNAPWEVTVPEAAKMLSSAKKGSTVQASVRRSHVRQAFIKMR